MVSLAAPLHPYYPLEVEIVGYLTNDWHFLTLIEVFAAVCLVVFGVTYVVAKKVNPRIGTGELWIVMWFVLCEFSEEGVVVCADFWVGGCIHSFFEGMLL
jgi:cholestenol delta-isomerase